MYLTGEKLIVFDSEGYYFDMLVIHFFIRKNLFEVCYRQLIIVVRCVNIQKAARNLEFLTGCLTNAGLFTYFFCTVILFSSFHIVLDSYCPKDTWICLNVIKSSFACGRKCIFQTVKMKQKNRDDIWWLVLWMNWTKIDFVLLPLKSKLFINFSIVFPLNSPGNVRIVSK
jgi:hypothetical protein